MMPPDTAHGDVSASAAPVTNWPATSAQPLMNGHDGLEDLRDMDSRDALDDQGAPELADLPDGRLTVDRPPTENEIEEAAVVVELTLDAGRAKADRATRGVLSALLALEALVVLLVPRAIAQTTTGLDTTKTVILVALAVLLLLTAFMMRRSWGVGLGSVLQVAVLATGFLEWVMIVIALVFIGLWIWVLTMRRDWVRTPGGLRMLVS